jgi:hypothetical protein
MLVCFMVIWSYLCPFEYLVAIWYSLWLFGIFSRFGMLYQEKSGNHARDRGKNLFSALLWGRFLKQNSDPELASWIVLLLKLFYL